MAAQNYHNRSCRWRIKYVYLDPVVLSRQDLCIQHKLGDLFLFIWHRSQMIIFSSIKFTFKIEGHRIVLSNIHGMELNFCAV